MGIKGRSTMNKAELERAVSRKRSVRPRRHAEEEHMSTIGWIIVAAGVVSS